MKNFFTKNTKHRNTSLNKVSKKLNRGFTLAEMLVVVAIFSIMTTVVIFEYGRFNSQTIMTNAAYEVALATRQAQVFALGVRGQSGLAPGNFDNRHGVYFNLGVERGNKDFIFFIDRGEINDPNAANGICDGPGGAGDCWSCGPDDECLEKLSLTRDIVFSRICISDGNEPIDIDTGGCLGRETNAATITFQRPNPDALVTDILENESGFRSAAIVLSNRFNNQRAVVIRNTGQISVEILPDWE